MVMMFSSVVRDALTNGAAGGGRGTPAAVLLRADTRRVLDPALSERVEPPDVSVDRVPPRLVAGQVVRLRVRRVDRGPVLAVRHAQFLQDPDDVGRVLLVQRKRPDQ